MATANLQNDNRPEKKASTENPTFRERMMDHNINGIRELLDSPDDAVIQVTRHIHGLATYIAATLPERENTNYSEGERRTDLLNSDIVSGAFSGLGYLAALANFFACEAACRHFDR